tara:strand:- start:283 stop:693 length:411 start_codon:yes stop_codon:yes gene_type:complete
MGFVDDCLATDLMPGSVVDQAFRAMTPTGMQAQAELVHVLTPGKRYIATRRSSTGKHVYIELMALTDLTNEHSTANKVDVLSIAEEGENRYSKVLITDGPLGDGVDKVQFLGRRFFVNDGLAFRFNVQFNLFEMVA